MSKLSVGDKDTQLIDRYIVKVMCYFRNKIVPFNLKNQKIVFYWEKFLNLPVDIIETSEVCEARFSLPSDYIYKKELAFICCRLNEERLRYRGKKVWFTP